MEVLQPNKHVHESITGDTIILNGDGTFPKKVIILERNIKKRYWIVKTKNGRYALSK
jgi:hypothetical protein